MIFFFKKDCSVNLHVCLVFVSDTFPLMAGKLGSCVGERGAHWCGQWKRGYGASTYYQLGFLIRPEKSVCGSGLPLQRQLQVGDEPKTSMPGPQIVKDSEILLVTYVISQVC